jgi:hypothetical protein
MREERRAPAMEKQARRNLLRGRGLRLRAAAPEEATMNGLIYLVGLVVVIMFILSFLGLR